MRDTWPLSKTALRTRDGRSEASHDVMRIRLLSEEQPVLGGKTETGDLRRDWRGSVSAQVVAMAFIRSLLYGRRSVANLASLALLLFYFFGYGLRTADYYYNY